VPLVLIWFTVACGQTAAPEPPEPPDLPGPGARDLVTIRLVSDVALVAPGQTFHVVVVFNIEPKWHIYWKNPGEGALPPGITLETPPGFAAGAPRWPRPSLIKTPIGPEYCYFDEVALFVPVKAPPWLPDQRMTIQAHVNWAVCSNVCKLGSARGSVDFETIAQPPPAEPVASDPVVAKYRQRLPRVLDEVTGAAISFDGSMLTVSGPAAGRTSAMFFADPSPGVTYDEPTIVVRDDRFMLTVGVDVNPGNSLGKPMVMGGLVALGGHLDDPSYGFRLPAEGLSSTQSENGRTP
jgi:thiol:disulfide interchange protein DsbD